MHTCPCTHAHTLGRLQVFIGLLAACSYPQGLDSVAGGRCPQIGEVGGGREKGLNGSRQAQVWGKDKGGCAGLGPTSGMQQVELLVPWQGQRGQAAQPVPSPCPPGLAPSPAHTLSRGLWYTVSEIPTIPNSPSGPAHLPIKRHLHSRRRRRGTASKVQKLSQYQS